VGESTPEKCPVCGSAGFTLVEIDEQIVESPPD
jgi:hypothetical protein